LHRKSHARRAGLGLRQSPNARMSSQASVSRDVLPPTPPGPEGSNGNGLLRVQRVPGAWLFSFPERSRPVADFRFARPVSSNFLRSYPASSRTPAFSPAGGGISREQALSWGLVQPCFLRTLPRLRLGAGPPLTFPAATVTIEAAPPSAVFRSASPRYHRSWCPPLRQARAGSCKKPKVRAASFLGVPSAGKTKGGPAPSGNRNRTPYLK